MNFGSKSGFHIILSIFLIGLFTTIFLILLPKTASSLGNQAKKIDQKIADKYIVDNYKAECDKLILKKKEISDMIINFKTKIATYTSKIDVEKKVLAEYKKFLERYQMENNSMNFKSTLMQYNSQKLKLDTITKIRKGCVDGLKNLENALGKVDLAISQMKSNMDTVEYKKLLVDSYKEINSMLESIKGIDNGEGMVNIEKLNEDFIREGVKLDVLSKESGVKAENTNQVMTQENMKKIVESLH